MSSADRETRIKPILLDAGVFIGALLKGDLRHAEARPLIERARRGELIACTTPGILSEVYAALTWEKSQPRHDPAEAAGAVRLLVEPPSAIQVLTEDVATALRGIQIAAQCGLTARRIHDARHAGVALMANVQEVYTYDVDDWKIFEPTGLQITGPPTTLARLGR